MKRFITFWMAVVLIMTSVPVTGHATNTAETSEQTEDVVTLAEYINVPKNGTSGFTGGTGFWGKEGTGNDSYIWVTAKDATSNTNIDYKFSEDITVANNVVIEMELAWAAAEDSSAFGKLFFWDAEQSAAKELFQVNNNGYFRLQNSSGSYEIIKKDNKNVVIDKTLETYTKIVFAVDQTAHTADIYIGDQLVADNYALPNANKGMGIGGFRIQAVKGSSDGKTLYTRTVNIKNFCVYEGTKPRDINAESSSMVGTISAGAAVGVLTANLNASVNTLATATYSTADKEAVLIDGKNALVGLQITTPTDIDTSGMDGLMNCTGNMLFNLNLYKKIGDEGTLQVIDPGVLAEAEITAINASVTVPNDLQTAEGRTYKLFKINTEETKATEVTCVWSANDYTLTFDAEVGAIYALAYSDVTATIEPTPTPTEPPVVGNKIFLNVPQDGLAGFSNAKNNKATLQDGNVIYMPATGSKYYLQNSITDPTDYMVVHMKLAWEDAIPVVSLVGRDTCTEKNLDNTFVRVTAEGELQVIQRISNGTGALVKVGNLSEKENEYTEFAMVMNWSTKTADIYINDMDTPAYSGWEVPTMKNDIELTNIQFFRLGLEESSATNSKLYIKDYTIYEGTVPRDISSEVKLGSKLYLNTMNNGLAELSIDKCGNEVIWANDHIIMKAKTNDAFYVSSNFPYASEYMVIRMKLGWQDVFPNAGIEYRDRNGVAESLIKLNPDTQSVSVGEENIVTGLAENEYKDIALAVNWNTHKADVYLDGSLVKEEVQLPAEKDGISLTSVSKVRPTVYADNPSDATLLIKDWVIYDGNSLIDITAETTEEKNSVINLSNSAAITALGNSVAMAVNSDEIYFDNELHEVGVAAVKDGDTILFPVKAIALAYGESVSAISTTNEVTIKGVTLATTIVGKEAFLTLDELENLAAGLSKTVTYEEKGFVVIGDATFTDDANTRSTVIHYLLYERPTQEEIVDLFKNRTEAAHPRVLIDADMADSIKENYQTNEQVKEWGDNIVSLANAYLKLAPPVYQFSNSGNILAVSRQVYSRALVLSMAYMLTEDEVQKQAYVDGMYEVLHAAGEFPDWYPEHFLDTGEMMMGFSIAYDWMYDAWSDDQKTYIETTLYSMGLHVSAEAYFGQLTDYYSWWPNTYSNWNVVCNGSITTAAIALYDLYPDACAELIELSLRGVENMYDGFWPSGAWQEGPGYWAYALDYTSNLFSTLEATFGTNFNLSSAPGLDQTLNYYLAVNGPTGQNNYHDAEDDDAMDSEPLMWLGHEFTMPEAMSIRAANLENGIASVSVKDIIFYNPDSAEAAGDYTLDYYMENVELVSLRESFEDIESAWISFHAGEQKVSHGHLDTGTYVVDMLGQRWAIDLGYDDYSLPGYDGSNNSGAAAYSVYRKRTEAHNLYVINPQNEPYNYPGQSLEGFVPIEEIVSKDKGAYSYIDLTNTYSRDVESAKRGFMLTDDRRSALIRDEITFKEGTTNEFYWFNNINEDTEWEIVDNKTIMLTQNGQTVKFMIDTNLTDYTVSVVDAKPFEYSPQVAGQNANEGIHKVQIYSANASGSAYVQVKFIPMDDPNADVAIQNIAIADWTIPDDELEDIPTAPTLNNIYRDGETLGSFAKATLYYEVMVPYNAESIPVITAEADDDCNVEVLQAESFDDYTIIKVSWKEYPSSYRTYRIKFKFLDRLENVGEWTRLQVLNHTASEEPEAEHPATKVSDNDVSADSRWAAQGEQWLCLDLGSKQSFEALGLSWWQGDERAYDFAIEISDDGVNFTTLMEKESCGKSSDFEMFELDEAVSARYVRYKGYGNSVNAWNSVTEFAVLTKNLEIVTSATDTTYQLGSNGTVTILCTGALEGFVGATIRFENNEDATVDTENYDVEEGSTKLIFKTEYLETLATGEYKVTLLYTENRSIESKLEIFADSVDNDKNDGDNTDNESDTDGGDDANNESDTDVDDDTNNDSDAGSDEATKAVDSAVGHAAPTGDNTSLVWFYLLAVSIGIIVCICVYKKKHS